MMRNSYPLPAIAMVAAIALLSGLSAKAQLSDRLGLPAARSLAPVSAERVKLGRKLFFDRRLSIDGKVACAGCHDPAQGFTQTDRKTPTGRDGRPLPRNAPTLWNVFAQRSLFHDGRADSLEDQALQPLLDAQEMGNETIDAVVNRIRSLPDYAGVFESAFGAPASAARIAAALAGYQRGLSAAGSPFDHWHYGGDADAMNVQAKRGYLLFRGKAECSACHLIEADYALFTDHRFHNTGVGAGRGPRRDRGREEITGNRWDRFRFKTSTLRNIALTPPYMHDGSIATLEDVIRFYNRGGVANEYLDPLIHPLGLSDAEIRDLIAYLQHLTSPVAFLPPGAGGG